MMKFQPMRYEEKIMRRGTFQNKISLVRNQIDISERLCLPELSLPSLLLLLLLIGGGEVLLHWIFAAAFGLPLVVVSRAALHCGAQASHCGSFSHCRA